MKQYKLHLNRKTGISTLSLAVFVWSSAVLAVPPEPEPGFRWVINHEFSDEFNGTELDTSKWKDSVTNWKGRAPAMFYNDGDISKPENMGLDVVSLTGGHLQIKNQPLASPEVINGTTYTIAGGALQSIKDTAHYGYYEVNFKASRINMSTTFWLASGSAPLPANNNLGIDCPGDSWSQELDIVESVGGEIDPIITPWAGDTFRTSQKYNTHSRYRPCATAANRREIFHSRGSNQAEGLNNKLPAGKETWQDFNTFAAWWKNSDEVDFYLNNTFSGHVDISKEVADEPFKRTMSMLLVTETYTWAKPYPTTTELNNDVINTSLYDWVRAYRLLEVAEDLPVVDDALISNAGFESGDFDGWVGWGTREVVQNMANMGDHAAHVTGAGAVERVIALLKNTEYKLTAYANVISGSINLGAKKNSAGGPDLGSTPLTETAGQYQKVEHTFNTGENQGIKLYMFAQAGSEFYLDDVSLAQIDPPPSTGPTVAPDIFEESLTLKSQTFVGDDLNVAFLYQTDIDREAEIVVLDGANSVTTKKVAIKAGYGHMLESIDMSSASGLTNPKIEIKMTDVGKSDVIVMTRGDVTSTKPSITSSVDGLSVTAFTKGDGEKVVLKTTLNSNLAGGVLKGLTLQAGGDIDDVSDITGVSLYHDSNSDGVADPSEKIADGKYTSDDGMLSFTLAAALALAEGETKLMVTYTF